MPWREIGMSIIFIIIAGAALYVVRKYLRTSGPAAKKRRKDLHAAQRRVLRPSKARIFSKELRLRRERLKNRYYIPLELDEGVLQEVIADENSYLQWREEAYWQVVNRALGILREARRSNIRASDTVANLPDSKAQGVWLRYWYFKYRKDRPADNRD